jgi:hypothetical protein
MAAMIGEPSQRRSRSANVDGSTGAPTDRAGENTPTLADMAVRDARDDLPDAFARAVASLRAVRLRPEIRLAEAPAPGRLAPFAIALTADIAEDAGQLRGLGSVSAPGQTDDDGGDIATGRFVVLHDPAGQEAWQGRTRIVAYVRAELEQEMAADPFLAAVGWTWLTEALTRRAGSDGVRALGGTVTRVSSESYGAMSDRAPMAQIELRASWTPASAGHDFDAEDSGHDLGPHLHAWGDVLASAAGLPPLPPGVAALPSRRF